MHRSTRYGIISSEAINDAILSTGSLRQLFVTRPASLFHKSFSFQIVSRSSVLLLADFKRQVVLYYGRKKRIS